MDEEKDPLQELVVADVPCHADDKVPQLAVTKVSLAEDEQKAQGQEPEGTDVEQEQSNYELGYEENTTAPMYEEQYLSAAHEEKHEIEELEKITDAEAETKEQMKTSKEFHDLAANEDTEHAPRIGQQIQNEKRMAQNFSHVSEEFPADASNSLGKEIASIEEEHALLDLEVIQDPEMMDEVNKKSKEFHEIESEKVPPSSINEKQASTEGEQKYGIKDLKERDLPVNVDEKKGGLQEPGVIYGAIGWAATRGP